MTRLIEDGQKMKTKDPIVGGGLEENVAMDWFEVWKKKENARKKNVLSDIIGVSVLN